MPCIFSLLPGGVNALKTSFHFSGAENAVFKLRFCTRASRFFLEDFFAARFAVPAKGVTFAADKHESG